MAGLGPYLSTLREERGLSLDEVARVTRVAPRFLEALEREDFTQLPASVFTKGYIRAYCQAVGVPVEEALARYRASTGIPILATADPGVAAPAARSTDEARRPRGTLLVSFALLVGFGVALFVVAWLLQSGRPEIGPRTAVAPAPSVIPPPKADTALSATAPETPPAPAATPPTEATPVVPPAAEAPPSPPAPAVEPRPSTDASRPATVLAEPPPLQLGSVVSPYRLVARTVEATWLRVRTDDGRATEETIPAGEVREWISNRPFIVTVGNAAGVALELNGRKLPPLGGHGAVINRLVLPPAEP